MSSEVLSDQSCVRNETSYDECTRQVKTTLAPLLMNEVHHPIHFPRKWMGM